MRGGGGKEKKADIYKFNFDINHQSFFFFFNFYVCTINACIKSESI